MSNKSQRESKLSVVARLLELGGYPSPAAVSWADTLLDAVEAVLEDSGADNYERLQVLNYDNDDFIYELGLRLSQRRLNVSFLVVDRRFGEFGWQAGKVVVRNNLLDEYGPWWEMKVRDLTSSDVLERITLRTEHGPRMSGSVELNEDVVVYWWCYGGPDLDNPTAWALWEDAGITFWSARTPSVVVYEVVNEDQIGKLKEEEIENAVDV